MRRAERLSEKRAGRWPLTDTLDTVDAAAWQAMAQGNPFVSYDYLRLLQDTGCVHPRHGWYPQYLLLHDGDTLVGAAPCFFKTSSS